MKNTKLTLVALSIGLLTTPADAAKKGPLPVSEIKRAKPVDFQSEILPFLRANCLACHNRTKAKADLILETPQTILDADAVVPGKPMESILFQLAAHLDDPPMPPPENKASAKSLNPQQLGLLKLWIAQGAKGIVKSTRVVNWQPLPEGLNPIYSVAITPDGQYAAAGRANQIFLYHVPSKKLITRLTDPALLKDTKYKNGVSHRDLVHSLTFNQTGDLLASGGYREVKLWRRQPVKALRSIPLNTDAAIIALSPDGQSLAVAEANNIRLINPNTGAAIKTLAGHKMPVSYVAFSPDNTQLLSGAADGTYHIWTIAAGKFISPKLELAKPSKITAVTWTTGGKLLVTAHEDNLIRSWDLATAQTINATVAKALADAKKAAADKLKIHTTTDQAAKAAVLKDATTKVIATKAATALTAATKDATTKRTAATNAKKAYDTAIAQKQKPAETKLAAAKKATTTATTAKTNSDKTLTTAKAATVAAKKAFDAADAAAKPAEANAKKIAGDANKKPAEKQAATKAATDKRKLATTAKTALTQTQAKEKTAQTAATTGATNLTKAQAAQKVAETALTTATAAVAKAKTTSDNAEKAAKTATTTATTAKTTDAKAKADVLTTAKTVVDTKKIADTAKVESDTAKATETAAAKAGLKPHKEMKGHSQPILALTRLPNNPTQILSGSRDGTVRHWDANTAQAIRSMAHGAPVFAIAISPDATKFASASENKTAKIWTASNGKQIAELRGQRDLKIDLAKKERRLAYAKREVTYHTNNLKAKTTAQTKAAERLKKSDEAKKKAEGMPIAAKKKILDGALAEKKKNEDAYNKLKADYDAEVKTFPELDKVAKTAEVTSAKAKTDAAKPMADLVAKDKTAATRKTAAAGAKKALDDATAKQQKPAETKLTAAQKVTATATTAKAAADKALTTSKTATVNAQKAFTSADTAAKTAEANAKKIAGDANKKPAEKQAATKVAADKRKLVNTAKTKLTAEQAKEKTAQTAATTATTKLTQAQAAQKVAETALARAKTNVANAQKTYTAAEKASSDSAKLAVAAKPIADKAKTAQDAAAKIATDKRKVANDSKTKRDKLNKDQAAAKKTLDATAKKVTTAETEYKKLEDPRVQAVNEFNLATKAKAKSDTEVTKAAAGKKAADAESKTRETAVTTTKTAVTQAEQPIRAIAFSADSQVVFTGGDDMKVHTWSATTGQPLESFSGHKGAVKALVFNGEKFISASADKTARVWSPGIEWKLERTLGTGDSNSPLTDRVNTIDFSPDGKQIATGSGEPSRGGEVQIWNLADGKLVKNFAEVHSDSVLGLEFSKDGKYIASASADKFVKVTDIATGKVVHSFEGHTHHALGVSWLPHGRQLVSVGADKSIRHWNFEQGERIRQRTNFGKEVTSIHYVGLSEQAVVTSGDKTVRLINSSNLNDARSYSGGTDYMYASAATPDGKVILAGGQDSTLRIWNMTNGQSLATFEAPKPPEEEKKVDKK